MLPKIFKPSALILLCLLVLPCAAMAADLVRLDAGGQTTVRADRIVNNDLEKTILAEGEVEIKRSGNTLYADRVLVNTETMQADAMGNVRYTTASEVLRGSRMLADLNTGLGKVYQARIYSFPTGFYLNGLEAERVGENLYRVKDGTITSCDDELPPWQFRASEINMELEGYATTHNTTFEVLGLPALWTPWMMFPVKTKRQSGLLFPEIGYSDRDGFKWSQSYFQTLGDSQDLTLTANIMSNRGIDWGLEYRYSITDDSRGMFMLDILPEDRMGEELYLDGSNRDDYSTRYWLRGKADHRLGTNTTLKLDLDIVSDRDYTDEFNFRETGFYPSRYSFLNWFRRDLDSEYSVTRVNKLNLNHLLEDSSLNVGVRYNDRLDARDDVTMHDLPKISWDMARSAIADSPVYFQMDSSYNYLHRREGSKGHIMDLAPALAMPLNFNDYLMIEPRVTWKPHIYSLERVETDSMDDSGFTNDVNVTLDASSYLYSVYDFSSEHQDMLVKHSIRPKISYSYQSSLSGDHLPSLVMQREHKFHRISYGFDNALTLKTSAWKASETRPQGEPDVQTGFLRSRGDVRQNQPSDNFADDIWPGAMDADSRTETASTDDVGRTGPASANSRTAATERTETQSAGLMNSPAQFDWFGTNNLSFFNPGAAASLRQSNQDTPDYRYVEFLRFNLAHSFYLDPYVEDYTLEDRRWGNIEGRLEVSPFSDYRLSLNVDTSWDVYRGDLDEISVLLTTRSQRGDFLSLDYSNRAYDIRNPVWDRYDDRSGRTHQVSGTAHVNIGYGFSVTYNTRYDIERSRRFENTLALNYQAQCWGISFIFHEDEREQSYYVAFDLAGLSIFGR